MRTVCVCVCVTRCCVVVVLWCRFRVPAVCGSTSAWGRKDHAQTGLISSYYFDRRVWLTIEGCSSHYEYLFVVAKGARARRWISITASISATTMPFYHYRPQTLASLPIYASPP
ncbi:hypothetical protein K504DRAFT_290483 [Pleomassaria siparia CBS 279.74]|uniref:Secreted protein n=1 Tax=Pleomassaria siparia CBS 279.74 TaxID=1314801 RepID=A0A6G1K8K2_9PLEO|nr:hypothetical protein K504DRAFT_290483 [Pleomassaria siparia CBS 279.74]